MLNKVSGLCRALYIVLAIVAAFIPMGGMDVARADLVSEAGALVDELAAATVIALPIIGTALGHIPQVGTQLTAVAGNLQVAIAGGVATAIAMRLYRLALDGVTGLTAAK